MCACSSLAAQRAPHNNSFPFNYDRNHIGINSSLRAAKISPKDLWEELAEGNKVALRGGSKTFGMRAPQQMRSYCSDIIFFHTKVMMLLRQKRNGRVIAVLQYLPQALLDVMKEPEQRNILSRVMDDERNKEHMKILGSPFTPDSQQILDHQTISKHLWSILKQFQAKVMIGDKHVTYPELPCIIGNLVKAAMSLAIRPHEGDDFATRMGTIKELIRLYSLHHKEGCVPFPS